MNSSDFRISVSNAFRAPHSSELLSDGTHHGAMRYEIGDPDLNIEKATQLDVLYEFSSDHIGIVINSRDQTDVLGTCRIRIGKRDV